MLKGPFFFSPGVAGVSGKAILMGSEEREWLPNHSSVS